MQPSLADLKTWAAEAGKILLAGYGAEHLVTYKGRVNLVTEMDQRSEDYLVGQIRSRFPEHEILAEESGRLNGQGDHLWIIDPLDGTTNYAHGLPIFSVSLAYAYRGVVTLGV
ncbi:MAG TPA: inositol monophosphatase family protein, partial [Anaerolineaceae bacterium]|nr:inositol monophosphatase family protein [Anaerolineaceae bacterium]